MRHKRAGFKLNRTKEHRRALLANLAGAIIRHEQIVTTLPKARALRPYIERLVTRARIPGIQTRRLLRAVLFEDACVSKLCDVLGPRYQDRPGGYTRIIKAGYRFGDNAPMAVIEFVDRDPKAKGLGSQSDDSRKESA